MSDGENKDKSPNNRKAFSQDDARDLVRRSIQASGGAIGDGNLDKLLESIFAAADAQRAASGFDGRIAVTSVSVTSPGGDSGPATMEARTGRTDTGGGDSDFPWSGTICVWFCPDGARSGRRGDWGIPYDPERCYLICIEWTFP